MSYLPLNSMLWVSRCSPHHRAHLECEGLRGGHGAKGLEGSWGHAVMRMKWSGRENGFFRVRANVDQITPMKTTSYTHACGNCRHSIQVSSKGPVKGL